MNLASYYRLFSENLDTQAHFYRELSRLPSDSVLYSETKELLYRAELDWEDLVQRATDEHGSTMRDSILRMVYSDTRS